MFDPAVVERLLTKLSALRATLDDAERKVLDGMIVAAQPVELHSLSADVLVPGPEGAIPTEGAISTEPKIPEGAYDDGVELHAMDQGEAPQSKMPVETFGAGKTDPSLAEGVVVPEGALDDGVELHAMTPGDAPQSKMPIETFGAGKTSPFIEIDEEGNYSLAT